MPRYWFVGLILLMIACGNMLLWNVHAVWRYQALQRTDAEVERLWTQTKELRQKDGALTQEQVLMQRLQIAQEESLLHRKRLAVVDQEFVNQGWRYLFVSWALLVPGFVLIGAGTIHYLKAKRSKKREPSEMASIA